MTQQTYTGKICLKGPAGTGKTTRALAHLQGMLAEGVAPESIMVLVPQRSLGLPYKESVDEVHSPGDVSLLTLNGYARRSLQRFWPLVAEQAGYSPSIEPVFLTLETAQYYMMEQTRPAIEDGVFDAISLALPRIAAQLLDNMAKAVVAGFPFEEVAERLCAAWGTRHSSRLQVYRSSQVISDDYRAYCREHGLLDFAMQLEIFEQYVMPSKHFQAYHQKRFQHLIAENIEEMGPLGHDFIWAWWDHWQTALLINDTDSGYRTYLGADPDNAESLMQHCDEVIEYQQSLVMSEDIKALEHAIQNTLSPVFEDLPIGPGGPTEAITFANHAYYPQMLDWVAQNIADLVDDGIAPGEIVVMAPFMSDSLRFALQNRLDQLEIPCVSHRPSRALRDEPIARALLVLLQLAHPQWGLRPPPRSDIADMLSLVIDGLDPIRAKLMAGIVYRPVDGGLNPFEQINAAMRDRLTYVAGERYELLRLWLAAIIATEDESPQPPDYFLSRLFGEVLSQPGFRFHTNFDAGRTAEQLIESARKFRQVLHPEGYDDADWLHVGREYLQLVNEGVLAATYMHNWQDDEVDAVFLAPAFTYLMRNRVVDYQFWVDIGAMSWWERLDQPLTHPYVLKRDYEASRVWTEQDEIDSQQELLYRIVIGLIRRCRQHIYLGISDLGEQGYEQRGPLLFVFQQILQRYGGENA